MKNVIITTATAVIVVAMAGIVFGAAGDVTVNATVLNACSAISTGAVIPVGNLNPVTGGDIPATGPAADNSVKCTNGTVHNVECNSGSATGTMTNGTDTITYNITCPASITGGGYSTDTPIAVKIAIPFDNYKNASDGNYNGTITVQLTN